MRAVEDVVERIADLELDEDLPFQAREWRWERVGWVALLAVLVLAVAGLFGNGPISWTSASTEDGSLEVEFERFGRRGGSQDLVVNASPSAAQGGVWEIVLTQDFLDSVRIDSTTPEPKSVDVVDDGIRYTFSQAESSAGLSATFSLTPRALWSQDGDIRLAGEAPVTVSQFLFP